MIAKPAYAVVRIDNTQDRVTQSVDAVFLDQRKAVSYAFELTKISLNKFQETGGNEGGESYYLLDTTLHVQEEETS